MRKILAFFRIVAFPLALCLCLGCFTMISFLASVAEAAASDPGTITVVSMEGKKTIVIGETDSEVAESVGNGTLTYNAEKALVMLNGIAAKQIDIAMNGDFTVELIGVNNIENREGEAFLVSSGNIIINGTGTLNLIGSNNAFYSVGDITVSGGSVNVYSLQGKGISGVVMTIEGNSTVVSVASPNSRAVHVKSLTVSSGTVKPYVDKNGKEVASKYGIATYGDEGDIVISGGDVRVNVALPNGGGTYGILANKTLTISGGTVVSNAGSRAIQSNDVLTICGGAVTATATKNTAIQGKAVSVEKGTVTATAGTLSAIYSETSISVSGGNVAASAGNGVFQFTTGLIFSGGVAEVNATAENGTVFAGTGKAITVSPQAKIKLTSVTSMNYNGYTVSDAGVSYLDGAGFDDNGTLVETNVVKATDVVIVAFLKLTGRDITDSDKVTVNLLDDDKNVIDTVTTVYGEISFTPIPLEFGEYTYYIQQIIPEQVNGITYDPEEYQVHVSVTEEGVNVFPVTITNIYVPAPANDVIIFGKVVLLDKMFAEGDFSFALVGDGYHQTVSNGEDGTFSFAISCDRVGEFTYILTQSAGSVEGITYDNARYEITVSVGDNGNGNLVVLEIRGAESLSFKNQYKIPYTEGEIVKDENGKLWYKVDGIPTCIGLFYEDGNYYCTDYDGSVVTGKYYVWRLSTRHGELTDGWYYFGEDGVILNGICEHPDKPGKLYYFVNGQTKDQGGLFMIGEDYYFTEWDGEIKTGKWYVWQTRDGQYNSLLGWRYFNEKGAMLNGICKNPVADNELYYFENGYPADKGLFLYGNDYYCTEYNGRLMTTKQNIYSNEDGKYYVWKVDSSASDMSTGWYYFDEKGVMRTGIQTNPADGKMYYYVKGKRTNLGLFRHPDGNYYCTEYNGEIMTGKYYVWKTTGCDELKGWRTFDANGKMIIG